MNPKQFQQFLEANHKSTGEAVNKFVNGKIDAMSEKLDNHAKTDKEYQEKIDGNITWVVRLIIGAVVLGIIATIFK